MLSARLPLLTGPAQCRWIGKVVPLSKHRRVAFSHVTLKRHSSSGGGGGTTAVPAATATEAASDDFDATFAEQWGARWPALRAALAGPTRHVALLNAFLQRPVSTAELPGAASLDARQPQLAALLAAAAGGAADSPVQALHWQPVEPAGTAGDSSSSSNGSGSSSSSSSSSSSGTARGSSRGYPPPPADPASGLLTHYWLDAASLLPPLLLDVQPGQAVLDMCAAPGGKSLVLAQLLLAREHQAALALEDSRPDGGADSSSSSSSSSPNSRRSRATANASEDKEEQAESAAFSGSLVCNELDASRRARLVRVLRDYVPVPARYRIRVTPHDGARFWGRQEAEQYDRVLLDAPCSSDRHVLQQAAARVGGSGGSGVGNGSGSSSLSATSISVPRSDWSLQRCRRIAAQQVKLLAAAAQALKPGGRLVYSTCSILDLENDQVVDRVLERGGDSLRVLHPPAAAAALEAAGAQRARHGWLLLPDGPLDCGPIYLAVVDKVGSSSFRRVKQNKYAPK